MFASQINKARTTTKKEDLPDFVVETEKIVSGIEDVEAVEEFYDFALAELDLFNELSEDLPSCDELGDDDWDEFDFDFDFASFGDDDQADINFEEGARRRL